MSLFKRSLLSRYPLFDHEALIEQLSEGLLVVNHELRIILTNSSACKLLGTERSNLLGGNLRDILQEWHLITGGWPYSTQTLFAERIQSPHVTSVQNRILQFRLKELPSPSNPVLILTILEYSNEEGIKRERDQYKFYQEKSQEAAINIMEDLARHRNQLERLVQERTAALIDSQRQLHQKEKLASMGAFAAGIAHEINNPIGAILLAIDNAQEQIPELKTLDEAKTFTKRVIDKTSVHAKRCGAIIRGILQFARSQPTDRAEADLNQVISKALHHLEDRLPGQLTEVSFEPSEALPKIQLNATSIEQVVINIVKNSLDSGDGEKVPVIIRTETCPSGARVIVSDKGSGMTDEQKSRLFDPFYTTRLNKGGTGLGMSIVHGIIMDHGGTIAVESEIGKGTSVSFDLPLDGMKKV